MRTTSAVAWLASAAAVAGCGFDRADRWLADGTAAPTCPVGARRCTTGVEQCVAGPGGPVWQTLEDCAGQALVCAPGLLACTTCLPGSSRCDGQTVLRCDATGSGEAVESTCDTSADQACREGACSNLCALARQRRSNVGCEYWAVDLDNAMIDHTLNAAAQQFAVVVSNPQPDLTAEVAVEQDDSAPGADNAPEVVRTIAIPPLTLHRFLLGPREVDGSPRGEYNTGTHTALTRSAYRVTSTVPVVVYQFNPLENVGVFSNDASLLKPVEALTSAPGRFAPAYVALAWPQTIAVTDHPDTNFDPNDPTDLRAFLTIVGTRAATTLRVETRAPIIAGGPVPRTPVGGVVELELGAFDVLNLETNDFNADFTGSLISADQPIVVFSGSEASDAPMFETLAERRCCADHLEEQLDPIRTAGKRFVASVTPSRTRAVIEAGSNVGAIAQPEFFRIIAVTEAGARVTTTLPGDQRVLALPTRGAYADIESSVDFMVESDEPVMLGSVSPSQEAAGIMRGLPGGDPSFLIVPPIEQYRSNYVFLTPDKYSFDFVRVIAPPEASVLFDGVPLETLPGCTRVAADGLTEQARGSPTPPFYVFRCQLSFPRIDPNAEDPEAMLLPGNQNDGVHRIDASHDIGLLVDGFDAFVSYAYAGGTELEQIVPE
jgi:hypothetical protein